MFTEYQAEMMKPHAGEKFKPSNGTEGELFMTEYCDKCQRCGTCELIGDTMIYDIDDERFPHQWQYGSNGQPTCTDFEDISHA